MSLRPRRPTRSMKEESVDDVEWKDNDTEKEESEFEEQVAEDGDDDDDESFDDEDEDDDFVAEPRASKKRKSVSKPRQPRRAAKKAKRVASFDEEDEDEDDKSSNSILSVEQVDSSGSIDKKPKAKAKRAPPKKAKTTTTRTVTAAALKTKETAAPKMLKKIKFTGVLTVALTGARPGDVIHGCAADTANVVLRVDEGVIAAPASVRHSIQHQVGKDALVALWAKQRHVSPSVAAMQFQDCPVNDTFPNHQPLGQACTHDFRWVGCTCQPAARFTIHNQGVWQSFAQEHGHGQELQEMVKQGRSVCYRDILDLMHTPGTPGGKTLCLRPKLFKVVMGPVALSADDPRLLSDKADNEILDATAFLSLDVASAVYEIDHKLFRLPESGATAPTKEDMCGLILEGLEGLPIRHKDAAITSNDVENCIEALKPLTVGGLKSLLQKTIRFHARVVDMSLTLGCDNEGKPRCLPAGLVAATAAALLFGEAGQFSPELQLYTKGSTSALKRTAVILVEDAWVERAEKAVAGLMALALATQRMPTYEPPRCVMVATIRLAAQAADSPLLIAWRKSPKPQNGRTIGTSRRRAQAMRHASDLLNIVKSFQGDMDMMKTVADGAFKTGKFQLTICSSSNRLPLMPICHLADQHTYRGIGQIGPSSGNTFAERFKQIFGSTTGFNPRLESSEGFEEKKAVKETRFAQFCVARYALKVPKLLIPKVGETDLMELRLSLDSGVMAAAAGPIPVKIKGKDILVMLGVRCPEDETVMLKPARTTRDLFGSLTDDERAKAVSHAREQKLTARSPVLKGSRAISFEDGCWRIDGMPWEEKRREGLVIHIPQIEAPEWARVEDKSRVLRSNKALRDALTTTADSGLVHDAGKIIKCLSNITTDAVTLRAISMLRQQYVKISMPVPGLDGKLGSDQLAAYRGDWEVYRLLALVSRLAPGALRPSMPPNFTVVNANLLRIVERWLIHGMRSKETKIDGLGNPWVDHRLWKGMSGAEEKLMEHQRCAIASMRRRDSEADTGHFLIMDTGLGKTLTSLCYLYRWLVDNGRDVTKRIIWVTPKGTVDNLVKQLRGTWAAPVWNVPRLSTAKKPKFGQGDRLILKDYHVNVIHADHLRGMIDAGLAEMAPTSVIVFDEVDEMYAPTLRTSAARRLAQLCAKFVAQTATPMRKNESQLLAWLSDTCSFPVDAKNLLVAASGMVSIQLELGIASNEELHFIPMNDTVRLKLRELLVERRWLPMAQLVQENTDDAMVKEAVEMAVLDRKQYASGGVLLVADTKDHAERLIAACNANGKVRAGGFETLEAADAAKYGIVVVPKDKDRGYNSACRLGAMVTGVYAGNGASRHQMRGRLRRLGQRRKMVTFKTVVMENSLLHLLHLRHDAVDSMNISLQELGDKFSADVLRALDTVKQEET